MKNFFLASLFLFLTAMNSGAQPASAIHENFDVTCVTASEPGSDGWTVYNGLSHSTTATPGNWTCTATGGRDGSPALQCTGVYGGNYNLDTSYLISPPLLFHGIITGSYYLDFDTKADSITLGGELSVSVTDSPGISSSFNVILDTLISPLFGIADSGAWVTHEINVTQFEDTLSPFYIVFRYVSTASSGSLWFFDNANTSTVSHYLNTGALKKDPLALTVIGNSTHDRVNISFDIPSSGPYNLSLYDMTGREIHKETLVLNNGKSDYTINNLNLADGMYLIKMGNGTMNAVTKTMVSY